MLRLIMSGVVCASMLAAAGPVARISSRGNFRLSGQTVRAAGVANWPLVAGDVVVTGKDAGRIAFTDGSQVYVTPRSRVELTVVDGRTVVRLRKGALAYKFTKNSSVALAGGSRKNIPAGSKAGRMLVYGADALWNPAEPEFYLYGEGSVDRRRQDGQIGANLDPNNYNLGDIAGFRGYEPDWGTPPGDAGHGEIPPPSVTEPGKPAPVSAYEP